MFYTPKVCTVYSVFFMCIHYVILFVMCVFKDVGLALRTLLATVDETLPQLPASTHREIEMAQKLLNSDLAELIGKMKLAQQYVMTR